MENANTRGKKTVDFLFDFRLLICFLLIFQLIGISVYVFKSKEHSEENGQHFVVDVFDVTAVVLELSTVDDVNRYTYGFTAPNGVYTTREAICEENTQYAVNDTIELKMDYDGTIVDLDALKAKNDAWEADYRKNMRNRRIALIISGVLLVVTSVYTIRKYLIVSKLLNASNGEFFQNGYTLDDIQEDSEKSESNPKDSKVINADITSVKKSVKEEQIDNVLLIVDDNNEKKSAKKSLDGNIKKPVKKGIDSSVKKPVKKSIESSVKKSVTKSNDNSTSNTKQSIQKGIDNNVKQPVKKKSTLLSNSANVALKDSNIVKKPVTKKVVKKSLDLNKKDGDNEKDTIVKS